MAAATVEISTGALRGVRAEDGTVAFRGIPYARPPVGELRLRPPEPPSAWSDVRDAGAFGAACPQSVDFVSTLLGLAPQPQSEDCLTVNVWTPALDGRQRPVLLWIHGGAFAVGSGARELTDGTALARRGDVVVVSCNYRLGVLGFLSLVEHGGERIGAVPNLGLLDQVAVLEWVRREIGAFGGDPQQVTVFGESAGAISIASLLAMPAAHGLFRGAILQSGSANFVASTARARLVTDAVLRQLGIAPGELADLRRVPVDRLLQAQMQVVIAPPVDGLTFTPVIDGTVLADDPFAVVADGGARDVAMVIGTTLDEMKLFDLLDPKAGELSDAALLRRCERTLGAERATRAIDLYRARRAERGVGVAPSELWTAVETDRLLRAPAMRLAELQAAVQPAVYGYLFTWPSPYLDGRLGACHALDIPFVFGTVDDPHIVPFSGDGAGAQQLSQRMQDAWAAFARRGDPSHAGLPAWPRYAPPRRATMFLGHACGVVDAPHEAERAFWSSV